MRTPTAGQLLDAWDTACTLRPVPRCNLLLASAAHVEQGPQASLGERDRRLVELRERLFGQTMHALQTCPACGLTHHVELSTSTVLATPASRPAEVVSAGDVTVTCRPLGPADVEAAAAAPTVAQARRLLVSRAIVSAQRCGRPLAVDDVPEDAVAAVAAALAEGDPLASIEIPLTCERCASSWTAALDIADYLWREVDAWAHRTLREVDVLARAYGWTERDVLALTPHRRRRYLELVQDA